MNIILFIGVFIFGLATGSFLNCVVYRLELKEFEKEKRSFLRGRSFCPSCKHVLAWYDLIPVISFFILLAKCRYCSRRISIQYPIVEILTALLFLFIFLFFDNLLFVCFLFLISCFLIITFVFDLKHYIIPDSVIFSAIAITLIYRICATSSIAQILPFVFSAIGAAAFFFTIHAISKGKWLGFGDVKLVFFMGLFLGWPEILPALFFSFFIGAIIGIILILFKKKGLKSEIPFGPFLILGTYIGLFWGKEIIDWYLRLII